ncbi:ArgP/LysG family DNA-binding transcriptional regulator [Arthrobacter sp. 7749]|nr:ArgP/LysG family DNA-binding transcriptional regulator [Arthrobacter sp. 7749]
MDFPTEHLQTFKTVIEAGTLESAARELNITASAVSQRLKALEKQAGSILFIRSRPIRTTGSGDVLLRLAREMQLLSIEAQRALGMKLGPNRESKRTQVSIAVNADSLASWFAPVFMELAHQDLMNCEILRNDEAHSTELLRSGRVMGAVTTKATPVQGCSSLYLGTMHYRAMATASFRQRWLPGIEPRAELAAAPMVSFDRTDGLQRDLRRALIGPDLDVDPVEHFVPDSRVYVASVAASLGWGMIPDVQVPLDGSLQNLDSAWTSDVHLYWQRWKVPSQTLELLTTLVVDAAREAGLQRMENTTP